MQQLTRFNEHIRSNKIRSSVENVLPSNAKKIGKTLNVRQRQIHTFPNQKPTGTQRPRVGSQKSRDKAPTRPENGPPPSDQGSKGSPTGATTFYAGTYLKSGLEPLLTQ